MPVKRIFRRLRPKNRRPSQSELEPPRRSPERASRASRGKKRSLADLAQALEAQFRGADDVIFRRFRLGKTKRCTVVFVSGMIDPARIEQSVIEPLSRWGEEQGPDASGEPLQSLREIAERALTSAEVELVDDFEKACNALMAGDVILALEGQYAGLAVTNRGGKARDVQPPLLEVTIRGPQDSFTETLSCNIALVRRRIRDPRLRVQMRTLGRRSRTPVALLSIEGVTPQSLVNEVNSRLDGVDIDGVLDTGYIEHLIEDAWWSPFPQHLKSERPDKAAAALLEGRAVLLAEGTPFALMMPATLDALFHTPEDSYDRWLPVNLLRFVRFVASLMSISLPGLYVALTAYHPGILPIQFLLRAAAAREGVAFPVLVEALLMQFFLELIREAGFRVPSPIGQTFGIVGGIILGQVGVQAGIVSEAMVIVVSATAISSFAVVDRELGTVLRLLGLPVMLFAALLGLPGMVMAFLLIVIHLTTLRSYGVPYVAPYPYYRWSDLEDSLAKAPIQAMQLRPSHLGAGNRRRLRKNKRQPVSGEDT